MQEATPGLAEPTRALAAPTESLEHKERAAKAERPVMAELVAFLVTVEPAVLAEGEVTAAWEAMEERSPSTLVAEP